mmetsp:Transcript_28169/g.61818  ORF Transcript_28169/g.61818 Transcript_28169/m.61818 type:complete len:801 (+) Transcript_28169:46-2448(+)
MQAAKTAGAYRPRLVSAIKPVGVQGSSRFCTCSPTPYVNRVGYHPFGTVRGFGFGIFSPSFQGAPSAASPSLPAPVPAENPSPAPWIKSLAISIGIVVAIVALLSCGSATAAMGNAASSVASISVSWHDVLLERTVFYLTKISTLNVVAKFFVVLLAGVPFIFTFGLAYHLITGSPLKDSFIKFYALINRLPGMAVLNEKSLPAALLVNFVFYLGLFTFAIFLGVVTDEVKTTLKSVKNGKYPVRQVGHTVILHWNEHTPALLRQMALAHQAQGSFPQGVAVLADKPKADMDKDIIARIKGLDLDVYTRTGSPSVPKDLEVVGAGHAAAVVVMQPEKSASPATAQAQVAASAIALSAATRDVKQKVVFQTPGAEQEQAGDGGFLDAFAHLRSGAVAARGGSIQVVKLSEQDFIQRFTTLSTIEPGTMRIYQDLLSPRTGSLRTMPLPPALVGKTYKEARRAFDKVLVCGYIHNGTVNMVIPDSINTPLEAGDKLIVLGHGAGQAAISSTAPALFNTAANAARSRLGTSSRFKPQAQEYIVIAMDPKAVTDFTDDFGEFAPKGSSVTFLLPSAPKTSPSSKGSCRFKYVVHDNPASAKALRAAGIDRARSVLIAGLGHLPAAEADAFVTAAVLQLNDAVCQSGRQCAPPHVVARVRKPATVSSINTFLDTLRADAPSPGSSRLITKRPDLFLSDDLLATMLAQTTLTEDYLPIVMHLLDSSEGAELYLREPERYHFNTGETTSFAEIAEAARAFSETAIGTITATGKFVLAPEPGTPISLQPGDRILVFACEHDIGKIKAL